MQTKKPPKKKVSDEQLYQESEKKRSRKRAHFGGEKLKEVDRYIKALDGYSSFACSLRPDSCG